MKLLKKSEDFLFPPLCLHCQDHIGGRGTLFCKSCTLFFDVLDPEKRCAYCFEETSSKKRCLNCLKQNKEIKVAAALPPTPPVLTFLSSLRQTPYLAKSAAAFLTIEFTKLGWSEPDVIVPLPSSNLGSFSMKREASALMARAFSCNLNVLFNPALRGFFGKWYVKVRTPLKGKRILLVGEMMGQEAEMATAALLEASPQEVSLLALVSEY